MDDNDENSVFEPENADGIGGDCSSKCGDADEQRDEQCVRIGEIPPITISPLAQSLANKALGSMKLIHTESEERTILERYSMK